MLLLYACVALCQFIDKLLHSYLSNPSAANPKIVFSQHLKPANKPHPLAAAFRKLQNITSKPSRVACLITAA